MEELYPGKSRFGILQMKLQKSFSKTMIAVKFKKLMRMMMRGREL